MKKILVAYFSASGVTAGVAKRLAKTIDAEIFEIVPKQPYTNADLNWMDKNSRSTIEMKDPNCRPQIASKKENMKEFDVVFVGFPIWWYREPSIIDTFMEDYAFDGTVIVPFATSGGSGLGSSAQNMQNLAKSAKVVQGKVLNRENDAQLKEWAEQFLK